MKVEMPYLMVICVSCVWHGHRSLARRVDAHAIMTTPSTQLQVEKLKETDAESDHGEPHHEHVEEGEDEHGRDLHGVATIRA